MLDPLRDSKIAHGGAAIVCEQDIARFEVAMNDLGLVQEPARSTRQG